MKHLLIAALLFLGCTGAQFAKLSTLGGEQHIKCYSGELLIYEGTSTGKVSSEGQSDGYFFQEKGTGKLMEVSGNCVIESVDPVKAPQR